MDQDKANQNRRDSCFQEWQENEALAEEMKGPVHALALHLFTPEEWRAQGGDVADSPDCRGGDGQAKEKAR